MEALSIREAVHDYYEAWAAGDRERVEELLSSDLDFRSPQDRFEGAAAFLECCWRYASGLEGVDFLREVYEGDRGFVVMSWRMEGGAAFASAEYVRAKDGKIAEILVVNNSPDLGKMLVRG